MAPLFHSHSLILCSLLTISLCFHGISGVDYQVNNLVPDTPGGKRFTEAVGDQGAKEIMGQANEFIWSTIFQQNSPEARKPIDSVVLLLVNDNKYQSISRDNKINVSAKFLPKSKHDVKPDVTSSIYHEMTHILQWTGKGKSPQHLLEGIGWFTNIKAKNHPLPDDFPELGDGDKWDQEDYVMARFLEYCEEVSVGFVAKLNDKMKTTYDISFFKELTGKSVDELWKDYKAKHGEQYIK